MGKRFDLVGVKRLFVGCVGLSLLLLPILGGLSLMTAPPSTPTPLPSTSPSLVPTALPVLPTIDSNTILYNPNQGYFIDLFFDGSLHADLYIYGLAPEPIARIGLEGQINDSEDFAYELVESTDAGWAIPYMVAALNVQTEYWVRSTYGDPNSLLTPYIEVKASLTLSPDRHTIAFSLCNASGGRGQWCDSPRLWLFNLQTGAMWQGDLGDYGIRYLYDLQFSDDNQILSASGCLNYPNAYFGWCGDTMDLRWTVASGRLLNAVVATPEV